MPKAKDSLAAQGAISKALVGARAIEVKASVAESQIAEALSRFGMKKDGSEARDVYFFDTPSLTALKAGVIARARRVFGGEHDSTVKFRPVDPSRIDRRWDRWPGFKIEVDASEKGLNRSASLTLPVKKGLIKRVVAGELPIRALFGDAQINFLTEMAAASIDYDRVVVLGPVRAHRWRHDDPACPWPITAELWRRDDGAQLMELSVKAPIVQAAVAIGGFMALLAELGVERGSDEQAKARWALAYYAGKMA